MSLHSTSTTRSSIAAANSLTPKRDMWAQILVVFSLISTVVINALANIVPFNGQTTGAISDGFPVYFVPAGYVFSIWSVIYLGLLAYAIYQARPSQRTNSLLRTLRWPFILGCIANSAWIFAWHYEIFPLTLILMLILLGTLIIQYTRLQIADRPDAVRLWSVHIPLRIYLGWITVATIANITILLYDLGWRGAPLNGPTWSAILLVIATFIGLFFALRLHDAAYTLVLVWAFVGIYIKFSNEPLVGYSTLAAAITLALAAIVALRTNMVSPRHHSTDLHHPLTPNQKIQ